MPFDLESYIVTAKKHKHSQEFIESTTDYIRNLQANNLPVIFSLAHLELLIDLPRDLLRDVIDNIGNHYTRFELKKRKTYEFRQILAPSEMLKYIQRWIADNILSKLDLPDECTAYRPKYSILNNANFHGSSDIILKLDLHEFFNTINEYRVYGFFKRLGYNSSISFDLAKLTTVNIRLEDSTKVSVLPQGAPSSPSIANQIAKFMDYSFASLAQEIGCRYSRYADDLTFSIKNKGDLPRLSTVKKIIKKHGFKINPRKTGYYKKGMKQYVTGLTVTHGVHVSKKVRKDIAMHIYYAQKYGPENHMAHWSKKNEVLNYHNFQDWLLGRISFVYSIDKKEGKKMFQEYKKINWGF